MEAQNTYFLKFHWNLILERENGPFVDLISFLSSLFKIFFWLTFLLDANEMLMMIMTSLSAKYLDYQSGMLQMFMIIIFVSTPFIM